MVEEYAKKVDAALSGSYLTGTFTAADICVSMWLAMAMQKCKITSIPDKASAWVAATLKAVSPYSEKVEGLSSVSGGEAAAL